MLSRVADAVYWMSRYMERAENVARFVDVNLNLALDLPEGAVEQWEPIVATTGDDGSFRKKYGEATRANVMHFLTFDADYPSSILSCLRAARENARSVREIISSEMWETMNAAFLLVNDAAQREREVMDAPHDFYTAVRRGAELHLGTTYVTMTHNEAWHFAKLGRLMERADKTSRILDVKYFMLLPNASDVGSPYDEIQWAALLKSASAFEMYRKRFGLIVPRDVCGFLLLDPDFPRAIRHCVIEAEKSMFCITGHSAQSASTAAEKRLGRLRSELEYAEIGEVFKGGLHEYLDAFQTNLNGVGVAIQTTFFGY
jgi:uncharacterized alpha-E superfamily protein